MKKLKKIITIVRTRYYEYNMGVMVDLIDYYNLQDKPKKAKMCAKQYDKYYEKLIKVMKND